MSSSMEVGTWEVAEEVTGAMSGQDMVLAVVVRASSHF